jgi:hypothetical protein
MTELQYEQYNEMALKEFYRYQLDNAWFKFEFKGKEFDMKAPVSYIFAGWAAYEKAKAPGPGMLLLGSEKLRTDEKLIEHFGLSSARGIQDDDPDARKAVADAVKERAKVAAGVPRPDIHWIPNAKGEAPTPVIGKGAILSTNAWSPLLNDTFIMAGCHSGLDFALGLSASEQTDYQKVLSEGGDAQTVWKKFILKFPKTLWDDDKGIPRVLLRELLGLQLFGYKPCFDQRQFWLSVGEKSKSEAATLGQYLVALKDFGFHERKKDSLIKRVSKWLFGADDALNAMLSAAK